MEPYEFDNSINSMASESEIIIAPFLGAKHRPLNSRNNLSDSFL
jgi:hypothetical protein